jgi:hypothetical protein
MAVNRALWLERNLALFDLGFQKVADAYACLFADGTGGITI